MRDAAGRGRLGKQAAVPNAQGMAIHSGAATMSIINALSMLRRQRVA